MSDIFNKMECPTRQGKKFWKEFSISKKELVERFKNGYKKTLTEIADEIREYFPFMQYWISEKSMEEMFQNIQNYQADWVNQSYTISSLPKFSKLRYNGKPLILKNVKGDYLKYNLIVDWFAEHIRLKARRFDQLENVLTFYQNHTKQVVEHCVKNYKKINEKDIRESIYRSHYECTEFRVTHICAFIDLWNAKRILDFSAGRGARLIGAIAREDKIEQYVGVDPDPRLHPIYDQIINRFAKNHGKFVMIQSPFESPEVKVTEDYDLVFTSPPYFNLEVYNDDPDQSISRYPNLKDWLHNFMFPCLEKAWRSLRPGGRLALNLSDPSKSTYSEAPKYTERVIKFCHSMMRRDEKLSSNIGKYEGVIAYSGFEKNKPRSPQPVWVWQKL